MTTINTEFDTELINSGVACSHAFRDAVNEAGIVAITDVQGRILEVNDNFCHISGYTREELIGQNHRILRSTEHTTEFFRDMYRTIARGLTWHGEICNQAKDGTLY
ncbi:MAG: PAS domain S-box protein, partial [Planctomycetaceae bacterium]|nr:PAS domain S-box protein [Planctomycetaceae bacterium]